MSNGTLKRTNDAPALSNDLTVLSEPVTKARFRASQDVTNSIKNIAPTLSADDRVEALLIERTALREEVAQVRRSLEEFQQKHEEELGGIREQLADTRGEKEQAEAQYRTLLGKVNTIKSQLGERLKADAVGAQCLLPLRRSWEYRKTYLRRGVA